MPKARMPHAPLVSILYTLTDWIIRNRNPEYPMTLAEIMPKVAARFIGREESPRGSNSGPDLQEFFDADSYDPNGPKPGDSGYAWCASAVCRIVQLAMEDWKFFNPGKELTFKRPTTPSAFGFREWSLAQDKSTRTILPSRFLKVKAGDIVIYKFSHIGVARTDSDANGNFQADEGNTNDQGGREGFEFATKDRNLREVWCVIRFTV